MPSHFSFHEGATLPIAGLTAWAGVMTHGQVKPGERVYRVKEEKEIIEN